MTTQWGAPLTGEQMKLLRAAGLLGDCRIQDKLGDIRPAREFSFDWEDYRLPANHIAYTLLKAGWLDGRNVRLWFGGDKAPDDWDRSTRVLLRGGREGFGNQWGHGAVGYDIIAYIAKDEVMESDDPDTVTIAKMTEADVERLIRGHDYDISAVLNSLGLIKPEPTREERFWAMHEQGGTTIPTHIKKWVKDALEFER